MFSSSVSDRVQDRCWLLRSLLRRYTAAVLPSVHAFEWCFISLHDPHVKKVQESQHTPIKKQTSELTLPSSTLLDMQCPSQWAWEPKISLLYDKRECMRNTLAQHFALQYRKIESLRRTLLSWLWTVVNMLRNMCSPVSERRLSNRLKRGPLLHSSHWLLHRLHRLHLCHFSADSTWFSMISLYQPVQEPKLNLQMKRPLQNHTTLSGWIWTLKKNHMNKDPFFKTPAKLCSSCDCADSLNRLVTTKIK